MSVRDALRPAASSSPATPSEPIGAAVRATPSPAADPQPAVTIGPSAPKADRRGLDPLLSDLVEAVPPVRRSPARPAGPSARHGAAPSPAGRPTTAPDGGRWWGRPLAVGVAAALGVVAYLTIGRTSTSSSSSQPAATPAPEPEGDGGTDGFWIDI